MKQRLQEGKIAADKYNDELTDLKDRVKGYCKQDECNAG